MNLHEVLLASSVVNKNNFGTYDLSDYYTKSQTENLISEKVDKVDGKGLSTNDFTTELKNKLVESASQAAINKSTLGYQHKNLLKNTATSKTAGGVMFTVNENGSITLNGIATSDILNYYVNSNFKLCGDMILSGCPTGGSATGYKLDATETGVGVLAGDTGQGALIKQADVTSGVISIRLRIGKDTVLDNVTFFPMLRYVEITDDTYEPYKPSVAEYIEALEKKIAILEEKSYKE